MRSNTGRGTGEAPRLVTTQKNIARGNPRSLYEGANALVGVSDQPPRVRTANLRCHLTTPGVSPAVAARVAAARANHPPAALGALDCVFPVVEEGSLARRGCLRSVQSRDRLALQRCVRLR